MTTLAPRVPHLCPRPCCCRCEKHNKRESLAVKSIQKPPQKILLQISFYRAGTEASLLQCCTQRWESRWSSGCPPASHAGDLEAVIDVIIFLPFFFTNKSLFSFCPVSCPPVSEAVPPLAWQLRGLREGNVPFNISLASAVGGKCCYDIKIVSGVEARLLQSVVQTHKKKMDTVYCGLQFGIVFPIAWVPVFSHPPPKAFNLFQLKLGRYELGFPLIVKHNTELGSFLKGL